MSKFLAQSLAFVLFCCLRPGGERAEPAGSGAGKRTCAGQALKPGQIDALISPIALYADTLLAEVLMASTYPLEVVQAARWIE